MRSIQNRESLVRRGLSRLGYRLEKTPSRHWTRAEYGPGYMVVDLSNTVRCGALQREYDATLEHVEWFLEAEREKARAAA